MNIGAVDKVFFVYEFIIVFGLVFRYYLTFEGNTPPTKNELILPFPDPPVSVVTEPFTTEVTEELSVPSFQAPVTKKEYLLFFNIVLNWCQKNIKLGSNRKIKPIVEVSFSKRGDILGYYQYTNKLIMMYVLKNKTVTENIQTFIHEYVHHLQIRSTKDNIRYNSLTKRKGYYSNDYEIEARKLSEFYLLDCCKELNVPIK